MMIYFGNVAVISIVGVGAERAPGGSAAEGAFGPLRANGSVWAKEAAVNLRAGG